MGYFDARLAEMHDKPTAVIPEMYGPNTDIGAYLKYNIGTLLPKRPRESTWTNLVDDLETVLKKVDPDLIVAPHPQLDSHADHQFTTVALAEALSRRRQRVTLLLYTNHADRNRYPYGPAGTLMSLPPPVAQDGDDRSGVLAPGVGGSATAEVVRPRVDARPAFVALASLSSARSARTAPGSRRNKVRQQSGASTTCGARRARMSCFSSTTRRPSSPPSTRSSPSWQTREKR